jgi:hypothetical protein
MSVDEPHEGAGPGPHPLVGRQAALARALWVVGIAAWCLAGAGVVLPGRAGEIAATALVVVLIAAPVGRVAWLAARWIHRGDPKFAAVAIGLIVIVLSGALVAA